MISLLNRYSYLLTSALVMGAAWLIGARFGGLWPSAAVAGTGLGMVLLQRRLRGGASDISGRGEIVAAPGPREPSLLFLYSDSCAACLVSQRLMDQLGRDLAGRARV